MEMSRLEEVKQRRQQKNASLVVGYSNGEIKEYYQNRIRDIQMILLENPEALKGAVVADKVIGKVASSILVLAGVKEIYAEVMSKYALSVLEENQVVYEYQTLVDYVENNDKTGMCPMENKYRNEVDIRKIYCEMIES